MARNSQINDDFKRISDAMDVLAKLIIQKRQDGTQLQVEYQHKLNQLNKLINLILQLSNSKLCDEEKSSLQVDESRLDEILRTGIEIIEKKDEDDHHRNGKYALIPVMEQDVVTSEQPLMEKKKKKKKKNKICCSFCNEVGHTRAKCEKRMLHPKNDI